MQRLSYLTQVRNFYFQKEQVYIAADTSTQIKNVYFINPIPPLSL